MHSLVHRFDGIVAEAIYLVADSQNRSEMPKVRRGNPRSESMDLLFLRAIVIDGTGRLYQGGWGPWAGPSAEGTAVSRGRALPDRVR
jgi:hypothetical protein